MNDEKICPIMSGPATVAENGDGELVAEVIFQPCLRHGCKLYISVYTTELISISGCAYELGPQMVNGQLRV